MCSPFYAGKFSSIIYLSVFPALPAEHQRTKYWTLYQYPLRWRIRSTPTSIVQSRVYVHCPHFYVLTFVVFHTRLYTVLREGMCWIIFQILKDSRELLFVKDFWINKSFCLHCNIEDFQFTQLSFSRTTPFVLGKVRGKVFECIKSLQGLIKSQTTFWCLLRWYMWFNMFETLAFLLKLLTLRQ